MKYIRTKDGKIVDIEKFINEEKNTPYYKDFEFEEITKDGVLEWTAIGTKKCSIKNQIGRRCHFSATLNSEVIKQADTIEELCDEFIITEYTTMPKRCDVGIKELFDSKSKYLTIELNAYGQRRDYDLMTFLKTKPKCCIFGAIWTDKGLIYVAKMNDKGELELL